MFVLDLTSVENTEGMTMSGDKVCNTKPAHKADLDRASSKADLDSLSTVSKSVSHAQKGSVSGLTSPRANAASGKASSVQMSADTVQMAPGDYWERVGEDVTKAEVPLELAHVCEGAGLLGHGAALLGGGAAATAIGTIGSGVGALAMGGMLGILGGEALWSLDKDYLSAGKKTEAIKEPEYEGHNPYAPDWYNPWSW